MHWVKLHDLDYVVRYYPHRKTPFEYYFTDQDKSLFRPVNNTLYLTTHHTSYIQFTSLVEVYLFLMNYTAMPPPNLQGIFEICSSGSTSVPHKKTFVPIKRPYLNAPHMYFHPIHRIHGKNQSTN